MACRCASVRSDAGNLADIDQLMTTVGERFGGHLDVLFINAAEHFEKGKRQNQLLPEHIDKIIDTYQHRKEEQRYSRRVGMEEIEQNDFNLNISRYVSTAEAEGEIDLTAVHTELVSLEQKRKAALDKHNAFLKELGLPPLP